MTITLRTLRLHADELVHRIVGILRVSLAEDPTRAVKERRCLLDRINGTLSPTSCGVGSAVGIALCPRVNSEGTTIQLSRRV